jgi:hypothetical protein
MGWFLVHCPDAEPKDETTAARYLDKPLHPRSVAAPAAPDAPAMVARDGFSEREPSAELVEAVKAALAAAEARP